MISSITNSVLALTILVLALTVVAPQCCLGATTVVTDDDALPGQFSTWHVSIINGFNDNSELLLHCHSKDDDLGLQYVAVGANFTWSFKEHLFKRTLFWCYGKKDYEEVSFKVFWQDVSLFYKCKWKNCVWIAKDDGIYIKDLDVGCDELRYSWRPLARKK